MSQKQFSNKKQQKPLRQAPHSQKSAVSAKESHASKKEAAILTTQRHNLTIERDWASKQATYYWKEANNYQADGLIGMALDAKTRCEDEANRVKFYNNKIKEVEKMIDRMWQASVAGLQKGQNYATMKVEEPPSDNQE